VAASTHREQSRGVGKEGDGIREVHCGAWCEDAGWGLPGGGIPTALKSQISTMIREYNLRSMRTLRFGFISCIARKIRDVLEPLLEETAYDAGIGEISSFSKTLGSSRCERE
tara:strand:- start:4991 stop:5326 length:336 start_codon:yes stop_codon:yes gene_type:complete